MYKKLTGIEQYKQRMPKYPYSDSCIINTTYSPGQDWACAFSFSLSLTVTHTNTQFFF